MKEILIKKQAQIREYMKTEYAKNYSVRNAINGDKESIRDFLNMEGDTEPEIQLERRKITKEMADSLEGDLTLEEMEESLFLHMKGSSSPGLDGFTVNYLRVFWHDFKYVIRDALNAAQEEGLTQTLRSAILKLLRKGDKDPLKIGNYRPISLLSMFYNLASSCITRSIKPAVESIIGKQQKAYVDKNNIGSCILNLINMMDYVNKKKMQ